MLFVGELEARGDGYVRSRDLDQFVFQGQPTPLLAHMKGIKVLPASDAALTIRTTFRLRPEERPYEDELGPDKLRYKRMRGNPNSRENVEPAGGNEAREALIWFYGVGPAVFRALYPSGL